MFEVRGLGISGSRVHGAFATRLLNAGSSGFVDCGSRTLKLCEYTHPDLRL